MNKIMVAMKKIKFTRFQAVFIILMLTGLSFLGFVVVDYHLKLTTWKNKTITGQINELILYNDFPDNELLVTFKNGDFVLITKNYMGSYAILSQLPENTTVTIKYEKNGFNDVYVKEIEWEAD